MKKCFSIFLCVALTIAALPFTGHAIEALSGSSADDPSAGEPFIEGVDMDSRGFLGSLSDWILGTDFGILSGSVDPEGKALTFVLPKQALDALTPQDQQDIRAAMFDILSLYLPSREEAEKFSILYRTEGELIPAAIVEMTEAPVTETIGIDTVPEPVQTGMAEKNLVFIHHSVGENWLRQGLAGALNKHGYHVADITYGWREFGDHTDTSDWPVWFTDAVMGLVYPELGTMSAENSISPADADNWIVLFKSCFPNSDVGDSIADEMAVYNSLLPYFASRQDKMFILVTPPPMIQISTPGLTRQLCNWLTDRKDGWLSGQERGNVFVFDLYNILTHPDAHHRLENGQEVHTEVSSEDMLYYHSDWDDHPNLQGNEKATEEFIPLLEHWYFLFATRSGNASQRFVP